jgi:hypothetical protein
MNWGEIEDESRHFLQERTEGFWRSEELFMFANDGMDEMVMRLPMDSLGTLLKKSTQTSTNGTSEYTLPSGYILIRKATLQGKEAFGPEDISEFDAKEANFYLRGTQRYLRYTIEEGKIKFSRAADATTADAVVIHHTGAETRLTGDRSETPALAVEHHPKLVHYIVSMGFLKAEEFELAKAHMDLFNEGLLPRERIAGKHGIEG